MQYMDFTNINVEKFSIMCIKDNITLECSYENKENLCQFELGRFSFQ